MTPDQGILDNISTGIVTMDKDLKVTALNAAGEALLETSAARCIGQHAGKLVLDNSEWLHIFQQVLASSSPHASHSFDLPLHSGQHILVDPLVSPLGCYTGEA